MIKAVPHPCAFIFEQIHDAVTPFQTIWECLKDDSAVELSSIGISAIPPALAGYPGLDTHRHELVVAPRGTEEISFPWRVRSVLVVLDKKLFDCQSVELTETWLESELDTVLV